VWPIASITKTVTALAALQLVADGRIKLDDDLNRYLKRLQVPAQGYAPLTLRHILSHTGALDEIPGRRYDGKQAPDMAEFLKDKLVRLSRPGKLTAYSTYGIALAGVLIEDVSGQSYADYLKQHIFTPAGMSSARAMLRQGDEKGVATPYEIDDGHATAIQYEWYQTPPTSSMVATAADMGRLLLCISRMDARVATSCCRLHCRARCMSSRRRIHPDLPGWSLGFQLDNSNGVAMVEHGGDIAGFSALFTLMPDKHEGFFIVNHGESGDLRYRVQAGAARCALTLRRLQRSALPMRRMCPR
jgi:CubicO group peptidase (beta-lactamase class C family)